MDKFSILLIMLAGTSWGTAGLFSNALYCLGFSPFQVSSGRMLFATVFMLLFVLLRSPKRMKVRPMSAIPYAVCGISLLGTSCTYYWAMSLTSFSTAVVLMYTSPIIVTAFSVIFLGERLTPQKVAGILGALIGCCLVTGIIGNLRFTLFGIFVGLLSGIFYSIYNLAVKIEMNRGDDPVCTTAYCFIISFIASLFVANPAETLAAVAAKPHALLYMAGMGFFIGAFPYLIYTLAMRKIPAGVASSMSCVEPMVATIVSVLFMHETLTVFSAIGILLILGSVMLLSREKTN